VARDKNLLEQCTVILHTRDLLNWFSSYLYFRSASHNNRVKNLKGRLRHGVQCWHEIGKEYFGETDYLGGEFIRVFYDDFFAREDYRKDVCDCLGGEYNERVLNELPNAGRYSSFDGDRLQGSAQDMLTLKRYEMVDPTLHHYFQLLSEIPGVLDLYTTYMPINQDKNEFLKLCLSETLYL
jgi:hypothetical protein